MAAPAFVLNLTSDPDVTAPILSSPAVSDIRQSTADFSVTTNEGNGQLYWYVSTSATPPSSADLLTGAGATLDGVQAVSVVGGQTVNNAGPLAASFVGYVHFLHRDAVGNNSAIVSTAQFTTLAAITPTQFSINSAGTSAVLVLSRAWEAGAGGTGGFTVTGFSGGVVTLGAPTGTSTTTMTFPISNRVIGLAETGGVFNYTQPGNGIEDADGNDVPSFSSFAVQVPNGSAQDTTAPAFFGSIPTQTWLPGVAITPINLADYFTPDGTSYSAVAGTLPTGVTLNTGSGVISGTPTQTCAFTGHQYRATNTYGSPDTNVFSITVTAIAFGGASIAGNQLTLHWNMSAATGAGGQSGFALSASGGALTAGTFAPVPGNPWIATLSRTPAVSETITISYTQPGNGVEDLAGNDLSTFSGQAVGFGGSDDMRLAISISLGV